MIMKSLNQRESDEAKSDMKAQAIARRRYLYIKSQATAAENSLPECIENGCNQMIHGPMFEYCVDHLPCTCTNDILRQHIEQLEQLACTKRES